MDYKEKSFREGARKIYQMLIAGITLFGVIVVLLLLYLGNPGIFNRVEIKDTQLPVEANTEMANVIVEGVHQPTGLVDGEGLMAVVNNCTNCHSAKIIIQNRMNEQRWKATIRWMQETQNLWDLGENEEIIVNYLVTNYPILDVGRRKALTNIEWYEYSE